MPRNAREKIEVEHVGNWQFLCTSATRPMIVHGIDLTEPPDQLCSCEDFVCRHGPNIRKGGHPVQYNCCHHVAAVMEYLAWKEIFPRAQAQGEAERKNAKDQR